MRKSKRKCKYKFSKQFCRLKKYISERIFDVNLIYSLGHYVFYTSCIVFTAQNNFFFWIKTSSADWLILCDTQITTKHLSSNERCREWTHRAKCFYVNESIDGYCVENHVHFFLIFSYINSQYLFSLLIGKKINCFKKIICFLCSKKIET